MNGAPPPPDGGGAVEEQAPEEAASSHALDHEFYRWLNMQFQTKPGRSVLKIEVFHVGGNAMTPIRKWDSSELEGGPSPLIAEIQEAADQDAHPMHGVQTYSCIVTFTDSRKHDPTRRLFRAMGGQSPSGSAGFASSEGPSASGLTVAAMRQTNAAYDQLLRQSATLFGFMGQALERAERRAERAEERQLEIIDLHADMRRKKNEQDFELDGKRDMRKMQNAVLEEAGMKLIPALAPIIEGLGQKLMGAPPPSGQPAPAQIPAPVIEVLGSLEALLKTLTPEAANAMIAALPNGEQKQKLLDLLNTIDRVRGVQSPPPSQEPPPKAQG